MRKQSKNFIYNKAEHRSKKSGGLLRSISTILCLVFVLAACVGCTSSASSDDVATLNAELNDVINELDSLKESYGAAQKEIDSLKTEGEAVQNDMDILKSNYETAQQEIASLKNEAQAKEQEIASLKSEAQAKEQEIASLKNEAQAKEQEIASLENEIRATEQEIASLENELLATEQEIASLKSEALATEQEIASLKNEAKVKEQEIDSLKTENDAMKQEIGSLQNSNEAILQEIEKLKEQIDEMQSGTDPDDTNKKIKIYIDQGHNPSSYHNSGAEGNGLYEQDLTFTIGILLAELLNNDGRFEICLSRPTETTVLGTDNTSSLDARVEGAKNFGADYFISLHVNYFEISSVSGIEVYVADKNSSSYDFGNALLQGLLSSTKLTDRGVKEGPDFRVLKYATMPAALLEMGFISNSGDAALLSESPELFAQGIYDGILNYFNLPSNETPAN